MFKEVTRKKKMMVIWTKLETVHEKINNTLLMSETKTILFRMIDSKPIVGKLAKFN